MTKKELEIALNKIKNAKTAVEADKYVKLILNKAYWKYIAGVKPAIKKYEAIGNQVIEAFINWEPKGVINNENKRNKK